MDVDVDSATYKAPPFKKVAVREALCTQGRQKITAGVGYIALIPGQARLCV